jgi:hypothetical protein
MADKLQQGRVAARVGDIAEARRLLRAATQEQPDNVEAWLALTAVVESLEEKRACLARVLTLDPEHTAALTGLTLIDQKLAASDSAAADMAPLPVNKALSSAEAAQPRPAGVVEPETLFCYRHPQTETVLRCNRCNKPICPKCAQCTPVGFRCPECIQAIGSRYYDTLKESEINPYQRPLAGPFFSYILLGLMILVWGVMELAGGSKNPEVLVRFGANFGPFILQGQFWRLFTSMFIHIGVQHLAFNFVGLIAFGFEMERLYGRERFLVSSQ